MIFNQFSNCCNVMVVCEGTLGEIMDGTHREYCFKCGQSLDKDSQHDNDMEYTSFMPRDLQLDIVIRRLDFVL